MKWLLVICGIFLFIGIANLPTEYYTFLRIVVTITAFVVFAVEYKKGLSFWNLTLLIIAIVFHPLIPVYLNDINTWKIIDFICGGLFMYKASLYGKTLSI